MLGGQFVSLYGKGYLLLPLRSKSWAPSDHHKFDNNEQQLTLLPYRWDISRNDTWRASYNWTAEFCSRSVKPPTRNQCTSTAVTSHWSRLREYQMRVRYLQACVPNWYRLDLVSVNICIWYHRPPLTVSNGTLDPADRCLDHCQLNTKQGNQFVVLLAPVTNYFCKVSRSRRLSVGIVEQSTNPRLRICMWVSSILLLSYCTSCSEREPYSMYICFHCRPCPS
jgi:hypothetical protein